MDVSAIQSSLPALRDKTGPITGLLNSVLGETSFKRSNKPVLRRIIDQLPDVNLVAASIIDTCGMSVAGPVLAEHFTANDGALMLALIRNVTAVLEGLHHHLKTKVVGGLPGPGLLRAFANSMRLREEMPIVSDYKARVEASHDALSLILSVMNLRLDVHEGASPRVLGTSLATLNFYIQELDVAVCAARKKTELAATADLYEKFLADTAKPLQASVTENHPEAAKIARSGLPLALPTGRIRLFLSIMRKDGDELRKMLDQGVNPNMRLDDNNTPLHVAAAVGDLAMVRLLLGAGADYDAVTFAGEPPAVGACIESHLEVVRELLEAGADVNAVKTEGNFSLLYAACTKGNLQLVGYLLEQGADLCILDAAGFSPLDAAVQADHEGLVRFLAEHIPSKDPDVLARAMGTAAFHGNIEMIQVFLDKGVDVNARDPNGTSAVYRACLMGRLETLMYLVDKGADIHARYTKGHQTCAFAAAMQGHAALLAKLLDLGADLTVANYEQTSPLHTAAQNGHADAVQLLLARGADPNVRRIKATTPLHLAAWHGRPAVINLLLDSGALINAADTDSFTVLHGAVGGGSLAATELLLSRGADVTLNTPNGTGITPLSLAARHGFPPILKFLINKGADPTITCNDGIPPAMSAAEFGHLENVRLLLDHGVDPNGPPCKYGTPLSAAALGGHLEIVSLLLSRGADISTEKYISGITPIGVAAEKGNLEIVKYLVSRGADLAPAIAANIAPLGGATMNGHTDIVVYLLAQGADHSPLTMEGVTPLVLAVSQGHLDLIEVLVGAGADPYRVFNGGSSLLHFAVAKGQPAALRKLVGMGVGLDHVDANGQRALDLAKERDSEEMVEVLEKAARGEGVGAKE